MGPTFLDCQGETTEIPSMQGVEIATIVTVFRKRVREGMSPVPARNRWVNVLSRLCP